MKNRSTAQKYLIILIFSLLPFLIGSIFSFIQSSKMDYFGNAINLSGSQRMRTMIISNYAQQLRQNYIDKDEVNLLKNKALLIKEIDIYKQIMVALVDGDESYLLERNTYPEIINKINFLKNEVDQYISNANQLIETPSSLENSTYIFDNSLFIKDHIDEIVEIYQLYYDELNNKNMILDFGMILIGVLVTLFGIFHTQNIKKNEYHAYYDALTKLQNRHSFYNYIKDHKTRDYSVCFFDLNKFKIINDTYGHSIGDEILVEVSNRLLKVFGVGFLYRYGGDEFISLIKTLGSETEDRGRIKNIISDIKRAFSVPIIDTYNREHYVGISMGIASNRVNINSWSKLINLVDELMYDSKMLDDHVVECHSEREYKSRFTLSSQIESAVKNNEIKPLLQSIFNINSKEREFFVVLGRWNYESRDIRPSTFLPLIKRKGLSSEYDKHMLESINDFYISNRDTSIKNCKFIVSILENTILEAKSTNFIEFIENLKIPRDQLIIKISELSLLREDMLETINKLIDLNISIAIDNFTVSYAIENSEVFKSVEYVNVSKMFVDSLFTNDYPIRMLEEFIKMLQSFDKKIFIEGTEDENLTEIIHSINSHLQEDMYVSNPYTLMEINKK